MNYLRNLWIVLRVIARRLFQGPRRPSWSWRYESFVEVLRVGLSSPLAGREQQARNLLDQFGSQLLRPNLANFTPQEIAGVTGVRAEPLKNEPRSGIILYLHGGGYVMGSVDSHRPILAELSHRANLRALAINYRLAPEARCPAAIEDVLKVYQALLEEHDPASIIFVSDSAGGGLAVTSMVALRDAGLPLPGGAILYSPWADFTLSGGTIRTNAAYDYVREEGISELVGSRY